MGFGYPPSRGLLAVVAALAGLAVTAVPSSASTPAANTCTPQAPLSRVIRNGGTDVYEYAVVVTCSAGVLDSYTGDITTGIVKPDGGRDFNCGVSLHQIPSAADVLTMAGGFTCTRPAGYATKMVVYWSTQNPYTLTFREFLLSALP